MPLHKDLTGTDLHVNKLHADTHAESGTDEITVTDLAGIDTDGTLAANSDLKVATQKAVKTYVDAATGAILDGATFTGDVVVPDEAYDATNWNGSLEVPTKNAVRDKIEAMGGGASALDDLTDVTITSPSTDEVLKYNGSAWVNGAVPGGSVPDWVTYDPLTPPAGYNSTVSDTFPGAVGASLNAKWTKTGAITLTTQINGGLLITGGTSASTQVGLIEQNAPGSTPYTITAPVQLSTQGPTMAAGVYVRESSGGKFWTAEIFRNSSSRSDTYGQTARYASTSSRTSVAGQTAIGWPFWIWVQLINDGTNLTCKFSIDGRVFEQFFTETIAASNLNGTTIDKIGIKWDNLSATAGKGTFREFIVT